MKKIITFLILFVSVFGYSQKETKTISEKNISGFSNYVNAFFKETKDTEKLTTAKYIDIKFLDERYKSIKSVEHFILLDEETKIKFIEDLKNHISRIESKSDSDYKTTQALYIIETQANSKDIYVTANTNNAYFSLSIKNAKKLIEFLNSTILS